MLCYFLGDYNFHQVEIFESSVTKMVLIIGHMYINKADIVTAIYQ